MVGELQSVPVLNGTLDMSPVEKAGVDAHYIYLYLYLYPHTYTPLSDTHEPFIRKQALQVSEFDL